MLETQLRLTVLAVALAVGGMACSSSSPLTGATAFTPNTQLAGYPGPLPDGGGPDTSVVFVAIAQVDQGPETCAELLPGNHPPVTTGDAIELFVSTGDGTPVATGSYDILAPPGPTQATRGAFLLRVELDAGTTIGAGSNGSVVLTTASTNVTGSFAGSFTTVLEDFDGGTLGTLSGTFSAPNCGVLYVF